MDITLYRYQLPLTQPLTFHDQTITQREGLLLHWGSSWSEIAPLPGFSRETLAEAEQEAIAFLTAFKQGIGKSFWNGGQAVLLCLCRMAGDTTFFAESRQKGFDKVKSL